MVIAAAVVAAFAAWAFTDRRQLRAEIDGLLVSLDDGTEALEAATAALAAEQASEWSKLLGRFVMVNDTAGDGYTGLLVAADAGMVRLERAADWALMFHDGTSKKASELVDFVNVPAGKVKFITGVS